MTSFLGHNSKHIKSYHKVYLLQYTVPESGQEQILRERRKIMASIQWCFPEFIPRNQGSAAKRLFITAWLIHSKTLWHPSIWESNINHRFILLIIIWNLGTIRYNKPALLLDIQRIHTTMSKCAAEKKIAMLLDTSNSVFKKEKIGQVYYFWGSD